MNDPQSQIEAIKTRLIDIAQLLPDFDTQTRDLLGLHGVSYDLTGVMSGCGESHVENSYCQYEANVGILDQLAKIATEWGWNGDGEPVAWMSLNIERVEKEHGIISDEHAEIINRAHVTITRIANPAHEKVRTSEETRALLIMHARLGHDIWVTTKQATTITGTPATTIRVMKHRGQLTTNNDGHINLRQLIANQTKTL